MDLIDYQPRPISNTRDEDNSNSSEEEHNNPHMRYILHIKDHFAKWSWAFPLRSKLPSLVDELAQQWPGMVLVHRRPKHPQSQVVYYIGLVERGNAILSNKLTEGINCTPYKAIYGQDPQVFPLFSEYLWQVFPNQRVVDANDLPVDIRSSLFDDNINHNNDQLSSFSGNIDTRSRSSNNTLVNTNTAYNNSHCAYN
ncbi:hypothetical protein INT45_014125 [Circinella minor]|uniref:Uncharacterized protein n=1 Tax=Circinella minor TaxID=1195481 RepID=A0A8H7R257_9FUNG|nr:hypothetical protein INT45_014125 [Circinella minor]